METSKTLILLVSDQTIPNFLSVKTFDNINRYVFVTTELMEKEDRGNRRKWIMNAANISDDKANFIVVKPENKSDVLDSLRDFDWNGCGELIANITGGTKMMSLAAYEFFKGKTDQIWYVPVGTNCYSLVDNPTVTKRITHKISVEEYLSCCGIDKKDKRYTEKQLTYSDYDFFDTFAADGFKAKTIEKIRLLFRSGNAPYAQQMKKKKKVALESIEENKGLEIIEFLNSINYPLKKDGVLYKDEMEYLTGGWFEEYSMKLLMKITGAPKYQFKLGVVLNPAPAQKAPAKYFLNNDLDVVFVNNNTLYVVECKSGGLEGSELFNRTVYLAAALRRYFMLTVRSVIFTMSELRPMQLDKAQVLGITIIDKPIICSPDAEKVITDKLNLK